MRSGVLDPGRPIVPFGAGLGPRSPLAFRVPTKRSVGVSGISADMRRLRADGSAMAQRAIVVHAAVRESGAMVACLGGLDVLASAAALGNTMQSCAEVCVMR